MLRKLRPKAVGFLLNSLELEEKPAHSGIFCEASHSLLCCPQGQNVSFVRSHSEPCHQKQAIQHDNSASVREHNSYVHIMMMSRTKKTSVLAMHRLNSHKRPKVVKATNSNLLRKRYPILVVSVSERKQDCDASLQPNIFQPTFGLQTSNVQFGST